MLYTLRLLQKYTINKIIFLYNVEKTDFIIVDSKK